MKKHILTLAIAAGFAGSAHAQLNREHTSFVGLKVGGSAATFIGDQARYLRFAYGFNAGLFANFSVTESFSVQPELLYSMKGAQSQAGVSNAYTRLNYIELPIALRYSIDDFFAEAGPQVGYLLTAKYDDKDADVSYNVKDAYQKIDAGFLLGLGYQPHKGGLGVGARYSAGVLSVVKDLPAGLPKIDLRNNVFQVYLTYSRKQYGPHRKRR